MDIRGGGFRRSTSDAGYGSSVRIFERLLQESYIGKPGSGSQPPDAIWSGEVPLPDSAVRDEATG